MRQNPELGGALSSRPGVEVCAEPGKVRARDCSHRLRDSLHLRAGRVVVVGLDGVLLSGRSGLARADRPFQRGNPISPIIRVDPDCKNGWQAFRRYLGVSPLVT